MKMFQEFWEEEDGITTVEILMVLAVLIIIALLFRETIMKWVEDVLASLFPDAGDTTEGTQNVYQPK